MGDEHDLGRADAERDVADKLGGNHEDQRQGVDLPVAQSFTYHFHDTASLKIQICMQTVQKC